VFGEFEIQHCPVWYSQNKISFESLEQYRLWQWREAGYLVFSYTEYENMDQKLMQAFSVYDTLQKTIKKEKGDS